MLFSSASLRITWNITADPGIARCMCLYRSAISGSHASPQYVAGSRAGAPTPPWRPSWSCPVLVYWLLLDAVARNGDSWRCRGLLSPRDVREPCQFGQRVVDHGGIDRHRREFSDCRAPVVRASTSRRWVGQPDPLLLGPMFVMRNCHCAWFSARSAAIIEQVPQPSPRGSSPYAEEHQVEPLPHS